MAYGWVRPLLALAALTAVPIAPARAEEPAEATEDSEDSLSEDLSGERSALSTVIFASLEAGPSKTFASAGFKRAIGGDSLAYGGFRIMTKAGGSQEQAQRRKPYGVATKSEAQTLLGYEWRIGNSFLSLYAGTDAETELRHLPTRLTYTIRSGARIHGDLWMNPTPMTMLHASAYVSTLGGGRAWGKLSGGWMLPFPLRADRVYLGPEIEGYRDRDYRKFRFGVHLTGLRLLGVEWRLSGGIQATSDRPAEAYATLGVHMLR